MNIPGSAYFKRHAPNPGGSAPYKKGGRVRGSNGHVYRVAEDGSFRREDRVELPAGVSNKRARKLDRRRRLKDRLAEEARRRREAAPTT